MWYPDFADRLAAWSDLRSQVETLDPESALKMINEWWFQSPWSGYYLHWDDQETWPDPWQLLSENIYCEVARGLGILYTISMLERKDLEDAELVVTEDNYNLVQVGKKKYILNWDNEKIVNTDLVAGKNIKKKLTQSQVKKQYK